MLGNPIFGTLLSQVPGHSVSTGVNMNQASNNVATLSSNGSMIPGALTVSVLQPSQQQSQSSHTQQIPLVSQHIQAQTIQGQSQQNQMQSQQHIVQQPTQFIHAHQLTNQQQQLLLQSPSQMQGQVNPLQNFVIVGAAPTMFVTSGAHGGNFLSQSAHGGNFFVTSAPPGLNVVGGLGGLVQTLTATGQQVGTSVIATHSSNSDPSIDATINHVVSSYTTTTSTPSRANTSMALGNDSFALSTTNNSQASSTPSRSVGGGGPFQCNMCERSYKYRHGLTQHIQQIHMGRRPFPCTECVKGFTRKAQLVKHMRVHTDVHDTFTCATCEEVFHMRESYLLHLRTHGDIDKTSYGCEICQEEFQNNSLLVDHYSKEHPDQQPPPAIIQGTNETHLDANGADCTDTNDTNGRPMLDITVLASNSAKIIARRRKRAARRLLLANQQLQANPNARGAGHMCNICGKRFLNHYGLKRHVRTHTGERPHVCDICGLSFMERSHMKQHRMTHTGETPYRCQYCHRGFNRKFSHERHIRWHTKGGLTYGGDGSGPTAGPSSMSEFLDSVVNEIVNGGLPTDCSSVSKSEPPNSLVTVKQESYVQQTPPHQQEQQQNQLSQNIYLNDITSNGNMLPLGTSFTMHLNSLNGLQAVNQQPSHPHQHNVLYATTDISSSSMNTLLLTGNGNTNGTDGNSAANFIHNAVVSESSNGHQMLSFTIPASSLGGSFNLISGGNAVPVMTAVAIPSGSVQHTVNGNTPNGGAGKHS